MKILYDIFKFLSDNANFALFIATFLLVIVTFLYVLYTKKMAQMMVKQAEETKRMADIMVKEYERKISPIIELVIDRIVPSEIDVELFNRGMTPVDLERVVFKWWYVFNKNITGTIEQKIDRSLNKEAPIKIPIRYFTDYFRKDEVPDSKNMSEDDLLRSVEGEVYVCYRNVISGELKQTISKKVAKLPK